MEQKMIHKEKLNTKDWEGLRKLGHLMVDDMLHYLQAGEETAGSVKPVAQLQAFFQSDLPENPSKIESVYEEFKEFILPANETNKGFIRPQKNDMLGAQSMLSGMLASVISPGNSKANFASRFLDKQVVAWCRKMIRYTEESAGVLVSGASMANTTGLIMARNATHVLIRNKGIKVFGGRLVLYASEQAHYSIRKAAEIMGIGVDAVRKVRVNENFEMDVLHLEQLINEDEAAGNIPFCVVATVGTWNTGAIDPLELIWRFCRNKKIWFHIDGSNGAMARMLPEFEEKLKWINKADSVAFDLHHWLFLPYEAGCILVKDKANFTRTFSEKPERLSLRTNDLPERWEPLSSFEVELSKGFQALKIWMTLKEQGIRKYTGLMRQNIEQAKFLEVLIRKRPALEMLAPVSMNVVCFRYNPDQMAEWELNRLNRDIESEMRSLGIDVPETIILQNKYCFRMAIHSDQAMWEDFCGMIDELVATGDKLQSLRNIYQVYNRARIA